MNRAVPSLGGCVISLSLIVPASGQGCSPQWWEANSGLAPQIYDLIVPHCFTEFDQDGPGPLPRHLYTAGFFSFDDGMVLTPGIARWDGFEWSSVAQGLGAGGTNFIFGLSGYDADGPGPGLSRLVACGTFANAGNVQVKNIAQWNGSSWSAMGVGFPPTAVMRAVASHDPDGSGPSLPYLVAAGYFETLGDGTPCRRVARWNGSAWSSAMQFQDSYCVALRSFDPDGPAGLPPVLMAWGALAGPPYGLFRWTGTQWAYTGLALEGTWGITYDTASPGVFWDPDGIGPEWAAFYVCSPSGLGRWRLAGRAEFCGRRQHPRRGG